VLLFLLLLFLGNSEFLSSFANRLFLDMPTQNVASCGVSVHLVLVARVKCFERNRLGRCPHYNFVIGSATLVKNGLSCVWRFADWQV